MPQTRVVVKDGRVELGDGRWVPHEPRLRPDLVRLDPPTLVWSSPDGRRAVLWWTSFPSPQSLLYLHRFDLVDPIAHQTLATDEGWAASTRCSRTGSSRRTARCSCSTSCGRRRAGTW